MLVCLTAPGVYLHLLMANDDNHTGFLLEDIQNKLQQLAESLATVPLDVAELKVNVSELKSDVRVIKATVTDQSHHVQDHEDRLLHLEGTA